MRNKPTFFAIPLVTLLACGGDGPTPPPPQAITGNLSVSTHTTGENLDLSAYLVSVGSQPGQPHLIEWNETISIGGMPPREHTIRLDDVADNCSVDGGSSRQVAVTAGATTEVTFDVSCAALPPAEVDVTGTWIGSFEGCDETTPGPQCIQGNRIYVLEQSGDEVTGAEMSYRDDPDDTSERDLKGWVSGNALTLFGVGWTRPNTGYQHRITTTGEMVGDQMTGHNEEQQGEWSDEFAVMRQ